MKRYLSHLIYIYVLACVSFSILLAGCKKEEETWDRPTKTLNRTLIFYMAGENSLARFIEEDSTEIANGLALLPEDCRVVMYIDDTESSRLCVGMRDHPVEMVKLYDRNICSTDSADMETVFNEIFKRYPAKSYGLVLWSHASGWVFNNSQSSQAPRRTFGVDNGQRRASNIGRQMELTTLANVLARHPHLDFIFSDACFMQCIEVAYELREVTDWVLGSPAEIPGDGAPYQDLMAALGSLDVQPDRIIQPYYDYYETGPGHYDSLTGRGYYGAILSAVKTSELLNLADATRPLVQRLFANRLLLDCSTVQRYCPVDNDEYFTEYYDMADIFRQHLPEAEFQQWWTVFKRAVPYRYIASRWTTQYSHYPQRVKEPELSAGVSMFVPTAFYDGLGWMNKYHSLQWYKAVGMNTTGW